MGNRMHESLSASDVAPDKKGEDESDGYLPLSRPPPRSRSEYSPGSLLSSAHIFVSGSFGVVASYDMDLQMEFALDLPGEPKNYRIASVPVSKYESSEECVLAVSRMYRPSRSAVRHTNTAVTIVGAVNGELQLKIGGGYGTNAGLACVSSCSAFDVPVIACGGDSLNVCSCESGKVLKALRGISEISRIASLPSICPDKLFFGEMKTTNLRSYCLITGNSENFNEDQRHHTKPVCDIASDPTRRCLVSCSFDKSVRLWDVETRQCMQTIPHSRPATSLLFSVNPNLLLVGLANGSIIMRDVRHLTNPVNCVKVSRGRVSKICQVSDTECVAVSTCLRDNVAILGFGGAVATTTAPARCFGCCVVGETGTGGIVEFAERLETILALSRSNQVRILVRSVGGPTRIVSTLGLLWTGYS